MATHEYEKKNMNGSAFWLMGGYGHYVWSAYLLVMISLGYYAYHVQKKKKMIENNILFQSYSKKEAVEAVVHVTYSH